jgi:hypothetical protein
MNNTLNVKRLGLALGKDFLENGKRYLLLFLTMTGIMAIFLIWISLEAYDRLEHGYGNIDYFNRNLLTAASLIFAALGLLFASTFMTPMNSKTKRISYLTLPASHSEKYLSRWLITTVGYSALFFVALYIVDSLRVGICAVYYPQFDIKFLDFSELFRTGHAIPENGVIKPGICVFDSEVIFAFALCIYLFLQSLFILGSTFWEKTTFVKTFTAISVIVFLYIMLCRWTILLSYEGDFRGFTNVLDSFEPVIRSENSFLTNRDDGLMLLSSVLSVFTLANWVLAFFRFRESEIIKRL